MQNEQDSILDRIKISRGSMEPTKVEPTSDSLVNVASVDDDPINEAVEEEAVAFSFP